jgi:hypothetical protein
MTRSSGTAPGAVDLLLDRYVGYLSSKCGVTVLTVDRLAEVRRFLVGGGGIELGG